MSVTAADLKMLAQAYLQGRDVSRTPRAQEMARAEASRIERAFEAMKRRIKVVFTDRDPYSSYEQMRDDVRANKRMFVYTGFSDTPLWTPEVNWKARAVHDWDHLQHDVDFSLPGEAAAFRASAARTPGLAPLYLSEIALQAATQNYTGQFAPQKLVIPERAEIDRIARGLRGLGHSGQHRAPYLVWRAAEILRFASPHELMVHLAAMGLTQDQAVPIAAAALLLRRAGA